MEEEAEDPPSLKVEEKEAGRPSLGSKRFTIVRVTPTTVKSAHHRGLPSVVISGPSGTPSEKPSTVAARPHKTNYQNVWSQMRYIIWTCCARCLLMGIPAGGLAAVLVYLISCVAKQGGSLDVM